MSQSNAEPVTKLPLLAARTYRFSKGEAGSLTIFALCLFMLMIMVGGIAVDLMRYESMRTSLQNTLDRATLAAASLSQALEGEDVVTDYFDKAGLTEYLSGVTVDEGLNYREVVADAKAATNPFFLHLVGIDEMDAPGHSQAEQRMTNVEIMLILDVSGSMTSNNRLTNLKVAANEFVNTVLAGGQQDRISVGIVPFNGQVNLGSELRQQYNYTNAHGVADVNCVDLPPSVYSTTGLSTALALPMTAHADTYSSTTKSTTYYAWNNTSNATVAVANLWCPPSATNTVMMPTNDISDLQAKISGMTAIGATSINAGMKWGLALLDPGSDSVISHFVSTGDVPNVFDGRPFEFLDPEAMKVVVLMTDGSHFSEERVKTAYKTGVSPVYRSPYDGNFSIRFTSGRPSVAGVNEYWVPHLGTWRALPWTNSTNTGASTLAPLDWSEVWAGPATGPWAGTGVRVQWVAWQLYARALGTSDSDRNTKYNTWFGQMREQTAVSTMDQQLQQVCSLAKTNDVTVYGIAFEAPAAGRTQISQCASSPAHYFNATGLQIQTAFRAIAANISQLRLTQ